MAYPVYDNFNRSFSRRQSIGYTTTPLPYQQVIYPDNTYSYGPPPHSATMPITHLPYHDDLGIRDSYYPDGFSAPRHRRHSTVSYTTRPSTMIDNYRSGSSLKIKFKRKGSFTAGISLREAQDYVRLSGNDSYSLHDFHADGRNKILLRIQWAGYSSMTYEIPLDGYDGHVSLQTVARRISRACVHYLQANIIPIVWDRVQLHRLEEISYGVWQPMLSAR